MLDYRAFHMRTEFTGGEHWMGGQPHRDNISAQLGMFTTHTTQGEVTGGSFSFTEADMRTIIQNWVDLARSYKDSLGNADRMTRIKPPAEDFASRWHAAAANQSGESYRNYLEHNQNYCFEQAQLFQNTLDDYLAVEHTNVTGINKTSSDGPQPGV